MDVAPDHQSAGAPRAASAVLPAASWRAPPSSRQGLARSALRFLGTPYVFGGTSSSGFDCSGFVQHVYRMARHRVAANRRRSVRRRSAGGRGPAGRRPRLFRNLRRRLARRHLSRSRRIRARQFQSRRDGEQAFGIVLGVALRRREAHRHSLIRGSLRPVGTLPHRGCERNRRTALPRPRRPMGCSQAVRQRTLTPSCVGSNPATPGIALKTRLSGRSLFRIRRKSCSLRRRSRHPGLRASIRRLRTWTLFALQYALKPGSSALK